ncbi:hypothetical protein KSP35_01465 [Aquihabitans sp. G128]|uniref:hypothetical protein n=1 Tax=Aquihabitans sp. G128 TaxID=2849779 RepID=UPI001C241899|nr:hypothetical protein [Aquihabitans sp. G128]QXC61545.1 hypothetical protein KSP35_01465 [Aquihabitans sp. G128]
MRWWSSPSKGGRPAIERARALVGAGVAADQVVVEVPFAAGPVPVAAVRAVATAGFAAGASLAAPADLAEAFDRRTGPADRRTVDEEPAEPGTPNATTEAHEPATPKPPAPATVDGWEIGALLGAIGLGVRTVRGVAPERFRRVATVLERLDAAASARDAATSARAAATTSEVRS